ncbi:TOMM system kinase/cyclase fusion protein [Ideonella sp. DXS29W]|uniref:TOMM system kinase/cyclase fusion protein n=1 Tax=Ideonella lacteola TaxID=2984193 RepID=A0ABU9BHV3_9BURK
MNTIELGAGPPGYSLVERLGEGASGVVYKARQHSTGQWVAVKFLRAAAGADEATRARRHARFARETHLCAQLHHPHIVRLLDQGQTEGGDLFAVFEFVPGETLRDLLQREGALTPTQAGMLMGQVLDALVDAHTQGIVHRDLKPLNIMVTRRGDRLHAKVLDFGIGTLASELAAAESGELTLSTETLGTPRYNAPEQLRGEPPTVKSDLYAWGLILLECLTGGPAVRGQTLAEVYHQHLSPHELPLPPALLSHPLGELLRRVLSKQARDRGETAAVYARFREVPLQSLVGSFAQEGGGFDSAATTRVAPLRTERRQITMLCFSLDLVPLGDAAPSEAAVEAMEELLGDQLAQCHDTCMAFGGHRAGSLGSTRLMYFGYPQASDTAARRAASAALELVTRCAQRSRRIEARIAARLEVRVALHTGVMLTRPGQTPAGLATGVAERLLHQAEPGSIVVSDRARRLLERHCLLEAAAPTIAMEDGLVTPTWHLCAERRADSHAGGALHHAPLVGRARETAALTELWRRAASGGSGAVLLVGEPGLGKTRLTQALCEHVTDDHGTAWVLQCLPEQRHSALHPFLRWLSHQLRLDDAPDAGARLQAELTRLHVGQAETAVILASWLGLPLPPQAGDLQYAPQRQRGIVLDALQALLTALSQGPAVLVIEDVHWADPTSRELIDRLLANGGVPGLGLVLTSRPDCDYRPQLEVLQLKGLAPAEAEDLLRRLPGAQAFAATDIARLAERADGNPLFLTELARARLDPGSPSSATGSAAGAAVIPPSLQEVLAQALDRLGPAKETAQIAAAIGREFEPGLVAQAAARDEAAVQSDLEQLFLADLVARQRRVQGDAYIFRHALIRDAAYDSLPRLARSQAHERIAVALESQPGSPPGTLAQHYAQAGRVERAVPLGLRAAGEALARAQHDEALGQVEAVRPWLDALSPEQRGSAELDLTLLHTHALMSRFGWADTRVRAAAERAHTLLDQQQNDPAKQAAAVWALATFHHVASDRAQVRQLARQLMALAEASPEATALHRAAYTLQGVGQWIDGTFAESAASLSHVAELPRAAGTEDAARFGLDCHCWSLAALANVRWFHDGDREAALALARHAVAEAEALGHIPTLGLCLMYLSFIHQHDGDRQAAGEVCGRLLELSSRYGLPAVEAYAALVHGWSRDDAPMLGAILEKLQQMGCGLGATYLGSFLAEVAWRAGEHDRALTAIDHCLAQADRSGEGYFVPELLRMKAAVLLDRSPATSAAQARALLDQSHALALRLGMTLTAREALRQIGALPQTGQATTADRGTHAPPLDTPQRSSR